MATTYEEIITNAHGYSSKSRPDQIATKQGELLALASRAVRALFAVAARANPEYWGQSENTNYFAPGWARPANAQTVYKITRTSDNVKVAIVPFDDQLAERALPAVFFYGRGYRIAQSPLGPTDTDQLTIWYARMPEKPSALTDIIDAQWEESFDNFLTLEVAIYLALKDGRMDEVATLRPDRDKEAQLFLDFMANANVGLVSRFGQPRRITVPTIMPLLAGGGGE